MALKGDLSIRTLHQQLGSILWNYCGMSRTAAGLSEALQQLTELKQRFWTRGRVTGEAGEINQELERAGRVADFVDFSELMCRDALARKESCGGHFREENQEQGEAVRDDQHFSHVSAWRYRGETEPPELEIEALRFDAIHAQRRSYQ